MSSSGDCNISPEGDINDVFSSIAFSEDNIVSSAFKEGLKKGQTIGEVEGYHLGYHRGAELGSEIGFYKGFLEAFIRSASEETLSRHQNTIEKLSSSIKSFPKSNDNELDIVTLRENIRATFKKLCSVLKLEPMVSESFSLSF